MCDLCEAAGIAAAPLLARCLLGVRRLLVALMRGPLS